MPFSIDDFDKLIFNNNALSVAFSDSTSVAVLRNLLLDVAEKVQNKNFQVAKQGKDKDEKNKEKELGLVEFISKSIDSINKENPKRTKALDEMDATIKLLKEKTVENSNQMAKFIKGVTSLRPLMRGFIDDASKNVKKNTENLDDILIELSNAGTFFSEGGRNISAMVSAANKIGISLDNYIKMYAKNTQMMIRAGNLGFNGTKLIGNQLEMYKSISGMSPDEANSVTTMYNSTLQYETKRSVANRNLLNETFTLGKFMKDLSIATGKTVESLVRENELKEDNLRLMALQQRDMQAFSAMKSNGFSDKEILYLTSGIMSAEVAAIMSSANGSKMMQSARELWLKRQQGMGDAEFMAGLRNSSGYGAAQARLELDNASNMSVYGYDAVGGRNSFMYNRAPIAHLKAYNNMDLNRINDPELKAQNDRIDALKKNTAAMHELKNSLTDMYTMPSWIQDAVTPIKTWVMKIGSFLFQSPSIKLLGTIVSLGALFISKSVAMIGLLTYISTMVTKIAVATGVDLSTGMFGKISGWYGNQKGKFSRGFKNWSKPLAGSAKKTASLMNRFGRTVGKVTNIIGRYGWLFKTFLQWLGPLVELISSVKTLRSDEASSKEKYGAWGSLAGILLGGIAGLFLGGPGGAALGAWIGSIAGKWIGSLFGDDKKPVTQDADDVIESSNAVTYNGPAGMTGYGSVVSNGPASNSGSSYTSASPKKQEVRNVNTGYLEDLVSEVTKLNHNFATYSANADRFFDRAKFNQAVTHA